PATTRLLLSITDRCSIRWPTERQAVSDSPFSAASHVPIVIYPNPLNPKRYIVINSGFTFREFDYLNNAQQVPKLPDYAVIDVDVPVTPRAPGGIVKAWFFGEQWQLLPDDCRGTP